MSFLPGLVSLYSMFVAVGFVFVEVFKLLLFDFAAGTAAGSSLSTSAEPVVTSVTFFFVPLFFDVDFVVFTFVPSAVSFFDAFFLGFFSFPLSVIQNFFHMET